MFDSSIKGFLIKFVFVREGMLLIIQNPTIHNLVAAFLILDKERMKTRSYSLFLEELGMNCFITQYAKRFFWYIDTNTLPFLEYQRVEICVYPTT